MFERFDFKVGPHPKRGVVKIVEVFKDGKLIATIYPHKEGLKIVSKLIPKDPEEAAESGMTFYDCRGSIPALLVRLLKKRE